MIYYLGLGSNLGRRRENLRRARELLAARGVRTLKASCVYLTEPVGVRGQPWFYNQVIKARSKLAPQALLVLAHEVEAALGRVRPARRKPRPIDIDILLAGRSVVRTKSLTVPHPRLERRNFVLIPLAEIAPGAVHPLRRMTAASLLARSRDGSVVRRV
jgi:2-amino-4-hydroxy-6-hydroxymethyldihydropteridine diphosphokinase